MPHLDSCGGRNDKTTKTIKTVLKRMLIFLVTSFLFLSFTVFAYDNLVAHPILTKKAVEVYEKQTDKQLTSEQKEWIIKGSINEDVIPRWLNHFFDPEINSGLKVNKLGVGVSGIKAKDWALNYQNSGSGDFSLPAILENYRNGDKRWAYEGIGHISHLMQDMNVPAHTRNDDHGDGDPYEGWVKDNGESIIKNFNSGTISLTPMQNIGTAFDELANYTHYNFLSKDTIKNFDFNEKIIERKKVYLNGNNVTYVYAIDSFGSKFILAVEVDKGFEKEYKLDDYGVHSSYFSLLAPRAIGYSAGVIEYFVKEFEKIDKEKELAVKPPFWQQIASSFYAKLDTIMPTQQDYKKLAYLAGDIGGLADQNIQKNWEAATNFIDEQKETITLATQLAWNDVKTIINSISDETAKQYSMLKNKIFIQARGLVFEVSADEIDQLNFATVSSSNQNETGNEQESVIQDYPLLFVSAEAYQNYLALNERIAVEQKNPPTGDHPQGDNKTIEQVNNETQELNNITTDELQNNKTIEKEVLNPADNQPPILALSPQKIADQASILSDATSSSVLLEPFNVIQGEQLSPPTGDLPPASPELQRGEQGDNLTLNYHLENGFIVCNSGYAYDAIDNTCYLPIRHSGPETSLGVNADIIPPTTPVISTIGVYQLSTSTILFFPSDDINASASGTQIVIAGARERDSVVIIQQFNNLAIYPQDTEWQAEVTLFPGQNQFVFYSQDQVGNISTSTATTTIELASPDYLKVAINEVAWMGTKASANDEWLELYNNTANDINLAGWKLAASDGTPNISLSGMILADRYYLLERTDNNTIKNIAADQIYTGALGNDGENLYLRDPDGNIVDMILFASSTPAGWSSGDNTTKQTMERINPQNRGDNALNWQSNNGLIINGLDKNNNLILGTPKNSNSANPITPIPTWASGVYTGFNEGPFEGGLIDYATQKRLNGNITLTPEHSPYLIDGNIFLRESAKLTILPGTIIKFKTGTDANPALRFNFVINGELIADGTAENPIVFTSWRDDNYGGDTNSDGSTLLAAGGTASAPAREDWGYIQLGSSKKQSLSRAIIKYGGADYSKGGIFFTIGSAPAIVATSTITENRNGVACSNSHPSAVNAELKGNNINNNAFGLNLSYGCKITIENNNILQNGMGIRIDSYGPMAPMRYNNIERGGSIGLDIEQAWKLPAWDVSYNYWGDASGPNYPIENPSGLGSQIKVINGSVMSVPFATEAYSW